MDPRLARLVSGDVPSGAPRIVCHGLVASDFLARTTFPLPRDRKVRLGEFIRQGGGPAANAAVAIARLGGRASFAGAVGDDALGREQVAELAREGVDVFAVEVAAGTASFVSFILVDASDGARTIFSAPAARPLPSDRIDPLAAFPDAALVLVDGWGGAAQGRFVEAARARGIPVLLDAGTARPEVVELAGVSDVVIASEPFAEEWTRPGGAEDAVRRLLAGGCRLAAVTLGPRGAVAGARGSRELFEVEAPRAVVVDTTGAGDAFHGGVAWALAAGHPWEASLRVGAFVAARKCERPGAREGLPGAAELRAAGLP